MDTVRWLLLLCRGRSRSCALACILFVMYSGFQLMYLPVEMEVCSESPKPVYADSDDSNITIITMYLNIGTFEKTSFFFFIHKSFATSQYKLWLFSWSKLQNRVIAFFDDDDFITNFKLGRAHLPADHTIVFKINRDELKTWSQLDRIKEIVANPSFKISYPPLYTCTMNAKYDALDMALSKVDIKTKYIAWMDIGLWRKLQKEDGPFTLKVPPDFNSSKVGFSEITSRRWVADLSPQEIYQQNIVWVAGGFVLATRKVLTEFIQAYRRASSELLNQGLADTDQQVIASMYSPAMAWKQKVEISTYACPRGSFGLFGHAYLYFCLPYICRASAECKKNTFVDKTGSFLQYSSALSHSNLLGAY